MPRWHVYIVECADRSLYVGISNDVARRVDAHNRGRGAAYTRGRRPVKLVFARACATPTTARRLEIALKKLDRPHRLRLVAGDPELLAAALADVRRMARRARKARQT